MALKAQTPQPTKLYLYLARRDKKGVRILASFEGLPITSRIDDVNKLGLDPTMTETIRAIVAENRMYWEPWIEPAQSYKELQERLLKRGYRKLPLAANPEMDFQHGGTIDTKRLGQTRIMTRRKK